MTDPDLTERRILLVEDDYLIAKSLSDLLRGLGATVVGPAPTMERALTALAGSGRVDAALLDINLRDTTVYRVADTLRVRGIPFVFTTGYTASAIPERYRDVAVFQKPFRSDDVMRALVALTC